MDRLHIQTDKGAKELESNTETLFGTLRQQVQHFRRTFYYQQSHHRTTVRHRTHFPQRTTQRTSTNQRSTNKHWSGEDSDSGTVWYGHRILSKDKMWGLPLWVNYPTGEDELFLLVRGRVYSVVWVFHRKGDGAPNHRSPVFFENNKLIWEKAWTYQQTCPFFGRRFPVLWGYSWTLHKVKAISVTCLYLFGSWRLHFPSNQNPKPLSRSKIVALW